MKDLDEGIWENRLEQFKNWIGSVSYAMMKRREKERNERKNTSSTHENDWWCELRDLAYQLEPWFDIDKVKSYAVYVWTKGEDLDDPDYPFGENVFDICADRIQFYQCNHVWHLPNEAIPIITKIQEKLRKIEAMSKKE